MDPKSKDELDNHSNLKNPNNDAYYKSRGLSGRQDDDDDDKGACFDEDDDHLDDNESFSEEWIPQDAW